MLPNFDASTSTFTVENAYVLMRACQAAYAEDPESFEGRLKELGIDSVNTRSFVSDYDKCFLGWTNDWAILAFRGTGNTRGWVSNILRSVPEARPSDYYGKVHPGFAIGLDLLWEKFYPEVSSAALSTKKLFITGHSRGGALATLAAQSLRYKGINPVAVYTFGAPRVGNKGFADRYDVAHHYRVENDRDIVPHVPPRPLSRHVGKRYWIDSEGTLELPPGDETPVSAVVLAALQVYAASSIGVGAPLLGGVSSQSELAAEFFSDHANTEYAYWLWKSLPEAARDDARTTPYA